MESSGSPWDPRECQTCRDEVRPAMDGSGLLFQACPCGYPVCRPCYEFERREGSQLCANCKHRYVRLPGSPLVPGEEGAGEPQHGGSEFHNVAYGMAGYSDMAAGGSPENAHLHPQAGEAYSMGDISAGSEGYHMPGGHSQQGEMETMSMGSEYRNPLAGPHHGRGLSMSSFPGSSAPGSDPVPTREEEALPSQVGNGTPAYVHPDGIAWKARVEAWKARQDLAVMLAAQNRAAGLNQPPDGVFGKPPGGGAEQPDHARRMEDARKPLSRIVDFPSAQITQYRVVIIARLLVIMFFFHYRLTNPVSDAYALWMVSVICEVWFAFSWILDQFPKWMPVDRETFLDRLSARYERDGDSSQLAAVDLFVSTVDPIKEPILTTANTILSILAMDYPVDKFSCYVSDDGAAMLTFEGMAETADFAREWVPFCKKFEIEPRAPEMYFSQEIDFLKNKVHRELIVERREMKEKYNMFKIRFNQLVDKAQNHMPEEGWTMPDGSPWPGNNRNDHPGMIQVFLEPDKTCDRDDNPLPRLVYVSREKRPGFNHHKKAGAMNALIRASAVLTNAPFLLNLDCDHYVNNSRALKEAMCFMMDPNLGKRVCYVQFPQRFDGIDRSDRYANHNTVFFDINLRGLDGIQGPVYVGTGCCFNRNALYGYDAPEPRHGTGFCGCCGPRKRKGNKRGAPGRQRDAALPMYQGGDEDYDGDENNSLMAVKYFHKRFGPSELFVASTLQLGKVVADSDQELIKEAMHTISCGYEDRSEWGKELGWIYGSVTEDILTGFKMHCRGWRSVYCMPKRPAFKGSAPINLSDRLQQVLRWALGSVEIFLSRHCPLWYGWGSGRLKWLERLAYVNTVVYPWTSFPLVAYCTLPAVCLLTNKFIIPTIDTFASIYFLALFVAIFLTAALEMRWSGVAMDEWWRNEQFWVIGGVSSHLFAVFQGLLKVLAGIDTNFTVTAKQVADDGDEFAELYIFKWTSLLLVPTSLIIVNLLGAVAGIAYAINTGFDSWGPLFGKLFFAFWVVVHLYPFLKGLMGRNNRTPTVVVVWAILLASIFSLLWVRIDPFISSKTNTGVQQCGLKC